MNSNFTGGAPRGGKSQQRQKSGENVRRAMNERRMEWSNRVRKAKRAHIVERKRRYHGSSTTGSSSSSYCDVVGTAATTTTAATTATAITATSSSTTMSNFPGMATSTAAAAGVSMMERESSDGTQLLLADLAVSFLESFQKNTNNNDCGSRLKAFERALSATSSSNSNADDSSLERLLVKQQMTTTMTTTTKTTLVLPALQLCQALAECLTSPTTDDEMRLSASRVLTNLAASFSSSSSSNNDSYYGTQWCDVLMESPALTALIQTIVQIMKELSLMAQQQQQQQQQQRERQGFLLTLSQQCCWAIGNVAGDYSSYDQDDDGGGGVSNKTTRQALQQVNAIEALTLALHVGLQYQHLQLCRNATWALSNLARGNPTSTSSSTFAPESDLELLSSNLPFVKQQHQQTTLVADFIQLLLLPEKEQEITSTSANQWKNQNDDDEEEELTWMDVALEALWVLAFLTSREDEGVKILVCDQSSSTAGGSVSVGVGAVVGGSGPEAATCPATMTTTTTTAATAMMTRTSPLLDALAIRLHRASIDATAAAAIPHQNGNNENDSNLLQLRMLIPCIRCIGNIGAACQGSLVGFVWLTQQQQQGIVSSLCRLLHPSTIQSRAAGGDLSTVAVEAAWASGTLLCDVGIPNHPSNLICQELLPVLAHVIMSSSSSSLMMSSSPFDTKLELKREALSALWNAISAPPPSSSSLVVVGEGTSSSSSSAFMDMSGSSSSNNNNNNNSGDTLAIRTHFLQQLAQMDGFVTSVTLLLTCPDANAVFEAVRLLDVMLRQSSPITSSSSLSYQQQPPSSSSSIIHRLFLEADGLDALEHICDYASSASHYGSGSGNGTSFFQGPPSFSTRNAADIAADLIDDLFSDEDDDDDNYAMSYYGSNNGPSQHYFSVAHHQVPHFHDGDAGAGGPTFAFGGGGGGGGGGIVTAAAAAATPATATTVAALPSMGHGRGRGVSNVPAWMQR